MTPKETAKIKIRRLKSLAKDRLLEFCLRISIITNAKPLIYTNY